MNTAEPRENNYWAASAPDELLKEAYRRRDAYYEFCTRYDFLRRWRDTYMAYFGVSASGTNTATLNQAGPNGENYVLKVNNLRSLLLNLLTMTTSQRAALEPKAENTDAQSSNQTILARSVLDYYFDEMKMDQDAKKATEFVLISAEGFVVLNWNATAGKVYAEDPNTGAPIYDGDIEAKTYHPVDVARECWSENQGKSQWYIVREFVNKYDLAAKYPDRAEEILLVGKSEDYFTKYHYLSFNSQTNDDYIPLYRLYHEDSEALPGGRLFEFLDGDLWLNDGPLPYKRMPVYRACAADWHGTPMGYTIAYDLLGIQKAVDSLYSIVATNQFNYGVQNIMYPKGANIDVVGLAQGLNGIEYDSKHGPDCVKPLNLVSTPAEIFQHIERLQHMQETLSGVNAVARGNIDRDMSGAALALIASQAVQFNNGLQQCHNSLLEDIGTGIIEILQMYAATPRIASIAGKSNRFRIQEFKGEDLGGIARVTAEEVNPVSKTAAGRLSIAQDLLKQGLIKTPQHYFEVLMTGNLDSMLEHETSQILLIRSENEDLCDGKSAVAVITDDHRLHILEHRTCFDSPEARRDPTIVANVTGHMQDHIEKWRGADPGLLMALGIQPLPPAPGPGAPPPGVPSAPGPAGPMPPPGPPHPPGPPGPPNLGGPPHAPPHLPAPIPGAMNATPAVTQAAQGVKPPGMPNLPAQAPGAAQDAYAQMKSTV